MSEVVALPVDERNGVAAYDVHDVDADMRARMLALLRLSYEDVTEAQFEKDLAEKEWVIIGQDPSTEEIWAFSTLRRIEVHVSGRRVIAFYSGDSASHPNVRGTSTAAAVQILLRKIFFEAARDPDEGLYYWFMISSTYNSYRLLSQLFLDYAPSPSRELSELEREYIAALSSAKGFALDEARSVVRFPNPSIPRTDPSVIAARRGDPIAAFYHERNPGVANGDRLASLASIRIENLTPLGRRFVLGGGPDAE